MEINMKNILSISDKEIKKVKIKLTKENVNNLFEYRDGDLYWKIDSASRRTKKGDIAGCIHNKTGKNKCYKVKVVTYNNCQYPLSRIIFLMFYGYMPEKVTFKDGNSLNTRIDNLLEANNSEVQYRRDKIIKNRKFSSNYKGVTFNKAAGKYKTGISKNNIFLHLGYFNTQEEAYEAYLEAKGKLHGKFLSKCNN